MNGIHPLIVYHYLSSWTTHQIQAIYKTHTTQSNSEGNMSAHTHVHLCLCDPFSCLPRISFCYIYLCISSGVLHYPSISPSNPCNLHILWENMWDNTSVSSMGRFLCKTHHLSPRDDSGGKKHARCTMWHSVLPTYFSECKIGISCPLQLMAKPALSMVQSVQHILLGVAPSS